MKRFKRMRFTCPSFVIFLIGHFAAAEDSTFKTEILPFLDNYSIKLQNNDSIRRKLSVEQINPQIADRRSMKTHNEPINGSVGKLHNYKVPNRFNGKTLNHKAEIVTSGKQE
jgi:hypothetical protein